MVSNRALTLSWSRTAKRNERKRQLTVNVSYSPLCTIIILSLRLQIAEPKGSSIFASFLRISLPQKLKWVQKCTTTKAFFSQLGVEKFKWLPLGLCQPASGLFQGQFRLISSFLLSIPAALGPPSRWPLYVVMAYFANGTGLFYEDCKS